MALAYDKILLFGDSIIQQAYNPDGFAFGPAMQNAYTRRMDVIQRGFSGYTSDHAAALFPYLLRQETNIKLMIIFFGTNDAILPWSKNHVPIERYKSNMTRMVLAAQETGARVIIIGPGPFDYYPFVAQMEEWVCDRTTVSARKYCDAASRLGTELGVPVVPMWDLIMGDLGWTDGDPVPGLEGVEGENGLERYLSDGLHFRGRAYLIMFVNVMKAIHESYPELEPESVQEKLPLCDKKMTLDTLTTALEGSNNLYD
ncbi:SGNH hydrolase-type esterase domain-containing protein [Aspergillus californicus]